MHKRLRKFDDAYSGRINDLWMGPAGSERSYMGNPVLGTAAGTAAVYLGGMPLSQRGNSEMAPGSAYTSAAVKYGAPVVGITLAGKALMDLAVALDEHNQQGYNTLAM